MGKDISMFLMLSLLYGFCNIYRSYTEKPYITPAGKSEGALALPVSFEANFRAGEARRGAAECKSVGLDHPSFAPILSPYYSMILRRFIPEWGLVVGVISP